MVIFEGRTLQSEGISIRIIGLIVENFTVFLKLGALLPYQAAERLRP